ncbi:formate/nitrite transporter family protein [Halomicrococcus gelatinilyticus]|uniref:formate/nitrite transporter family protein n=1 Tax=Halomicrococcus gelatinilyticus TaxID=1702103 RepID=UPI002E132F38
MTRIAVANAYAVGFIFVIVGQSELFTEHTTRATLPAVDGSVSYRRVGRLWAPVYGGNVIGGALFAVTMVYLAPAYGIAYLPHSIAGNVEVLAATVAAPAVGVLDYAGFLALATLGNAVGGIVFVSLLKYNHVIRGS